MRINDIGDRAVGITCMIISALLMLLLYLDIV